MGDIVIDLEVEACPETCKNFLKLCKVYYYNLNAFFNGQSPPLPAQVQRLTFTRRTQSRRIFWRRSVTLQLPVLEANASGL